MAREDSRLDQGIVPKANRAIITGATDQFAIRAYGECRYALPVALARFLAKALLARGRAVGLDARLIIKIGNPNIDLHFVYVGRCGGERLAV